MGVSLTLLPVLATERSPNSLLAVTSQAMRELASPRIGLRVAVLNEFVDRSYELEARLAAHRQAYSACSTSESG